MARYGRIIHGEFTVNNITFENVAARREFAKEFENYHASHDHDGAVPVFEEINTKDVENYNIVRARTWGDKYLTIDGYEAHEIYDYHHWDGVDRMTGNPRYRPPTCCISPLIVLEPETLRGDGPFVDSGALERHELSSIFGGMHAEEFKDLVASIKDIGFTDSHIRMYEGKVLDGWHRYRAALELNIVRKLRFTTWNTEGEGDPVAFVQARNLERRMLSAGQRAQIVYSLTERFGRGGDRSKVPKGTLKTREDMAVKANVGVRTIARAAEVEKAGRADEVISGEKTAGEVIKEETLKSLWEQINPAISAWKQAREGVGHASKTMFIKATLRWEGLPAKTETDVKVLKELLNLLTRTDTNILEDLIRKQLDGKSLWDGWDDAADVSDETEPEPPAETDEAEREAQRLLRQKKMVLKAMWETRKEASKVWMGTADNDLTTYTDLPELEKGFVENNPAYADAFKVAMQHTSVASLEELIERVLILDIGVDQLEKENRALTTYIGDLRNWDRPDWSPDTNWILPLIRAKKAAADTEPEEIANTPESEVNEAARKKELSDEIRAYLPVWIGNATQLQPLSGNESKMTLKMLLEAHWHFKHGRARGGNSPLWADEMEEVLETLKSGDTAFMDKMRKVMENVAPELFVEATEASPAADVPDMDALWAAFNKQYPKWKEKYAESGYKENDLIQASTEAELFDALRSYRHSDKTGLPTADEIKDVTYLMKRVSYPFSRHVRNILREKKASESQTGHDIEQIAYITICWTDGDKNATGDDKSKLVFFNSEERGPGKCGRMTTEIPETLQQQLLEIAASGKLTSDDHSA